MIIGPLQLRIPEGWRDDTSYVFRPASGEDELNVSIQDLEDESSAKAFLQRKTTEMEEAFPDGVSFAPLVETRIGGEPAMATSYTFGDAEPALREHLAAALLDRESALLIGYRTADTRRLEASRSFDHILASVRPAGSAEMGSAAPGYRRHQAGPIYLDVPRHLRPPPVRVFADPRSALRLTVIAGEVARPPHPPLAEEMSAAAQAEEAQPLPERPGIAGLHYRYVLPARAAKAASDRLVQRAHVIVNESSVDLRLSAPSDTEADVAAVWEALIDSLAPAPDRGAP